jgi:hypothetical protein
MLNPNQFDVVSPGGMWEATALSSQGIGRAIDSTGADANVRLSAYPAVNRDTGRREYNFVASNQKSPFQFREGTVSTPTRARIAAESAARRITEHRDLRTGKQPWQGPY